MNIHKILCFHRSLPANTLSEGKKGISSTKITYIGSKKIVIEF